MCVYCSHMHTCICVCICVYVCTLSRATDTLTNQVFELSSHMVQQKKKSVQAACVWQMVCEGKLTQEIMHAIRRYEVCVCVCVCVYVCVCMCVCVYSLRVSSFPLHNS
jgi:hypothetical protein